MEEELEILESIYFDDILSIDIKCPNPYFEILLHPSSVDENENNRLIKLHMKTYFPPDYPQRIPSFEFAEAKGITDENIINIRRGVQELAQSIVGEPMIFEIIQFCKDKLSDLGQLPQSYNCSICLNGFQNTNDTAYNLECYHYFHIACLLSHLEYMKIDIETERIEAQINRLIRKTRKVNCPDCRQELTNNELKNLENISKNIKKDSKKELPLVNQNGEFIISEYSRRKQKEMQTIFEKQKNAGGIIMENDQEIIALNREDQDANEDSLHGIEFDQDLLRALNLSSH